MTNKWKIPYDTRLTGFVLQKSLTDDIIFWLPWSLTVNTPLHLSLYFLRDSTMEISFQYDILEVTVIKTQ